MVTEFFLPIVPPTCTHQEKKIGVRNGKPYTYEPEQLKDARQKLTAHLGSRVPKEPYSTAVRVMVKWCFPRPADRQDGEWKTTVPDTHNMDKLLFDVMTDLGFWTDDAIVASEIIEKFWANRPGIYIRIDQLTEVGP